MPEKNDEKPNGNVIKGPWTPKEIVSENELDATKALKLAFAEALTQQIVVQLIYTMSQNDVDVADKSFVYDVGLIIELTKGCIYRSIGLPHPTHLLTEVLKSLPTDKYSEDHVAEVLEMLESMEEVDDDEPEFE